MTNKLTNKQQKFVDEYLQCFNATEAARRAGYAKTNGSLRAIGSENLAKPNIAEIIAQHFQASAMSRDEVLMRLGEQARGDMGEFANINNMLDIEAHPQSHLIKKFKRRLQTFKDARPIGPYRRRSPRRSSRRESSERAS